MNDRPPGFDTSHWNSGPPAPKKENQTQEERRCMMGLTVFLVLIVLTIGVVFDVIYSQTQESLNRIEQIERRLGPEEWKSP